MSYRTLRIMLIVIAICCVCNAIIGYMGLVSPLLGALGWLVAGVASLERAKDIRIINELSNAMKESETNDG